MQTRETSIKQKIGGMTIHSLGTPKGLASTHSAAPLALPGAGTRKALSLNCSKYGGRRWRRGLKRGFQVPASGGESSKDDLGDARVQSLGNWGAAPAKEAPGGPAPREAAWGLAQPGGKGCAVARGVRAEPRACASHLGGSPACWPRARGAAGVGGCGRRAGRRPQARPTVWRWRGELAAPFRRSRVSTAVLGLPSCPALTS